MTTETKHDVFCVLPWNHLHIDTSGLVRSCCVSNTTYGNINSNSVQEIWEGQEATQFRNKLLSNTPDKNCGNCYTREQSGKTSIRQESNVKYPDLVNAIKEGKAVPHQPTYVDIRFSNLCNLRCRTCWHGASSSWYEEAKTLKRSAGETPLIKSIDNFNHFNSQFVKLIPTLEEAYFAGGEPLLMVEHYTMLDAFIKTGNTSLRLRYNTNLSVLQHLKWDVLKLWSQFEHLEIGVSVDQIGIKAEYVRKDIKWESFIDNFKQLKRALPKANIYIAPTISIFNIHELEDIHKYFVEQELITSDDIYFNILDRPNYFNVQVLPESIKERIAQQLSQYADGLTEKANAGLRECINYMMARDQSKLLPTLRKELHLLDELRNERFEEVFPEMMENIRN